MGASNPQSTPSPLPNLAKVEAAISGLVDRLADVGQMPLRDINAATLSICRLTKLRDGLRSEVVTATKEQEGPALPLDHAVTETQFRALALLYHASKKLEDPDTCFQLVSTAKDGDRIGKHAGQGARWTLYLQAAIALNQSGRTANLEAVDAAVRIFRAPASIRAFLRAAGVSDVEVVNGN